MGNYDDIINMEHHVSKKHPQMSLHDRSAQFAPFAALVGFDDMVAETTRITDEKLEINEEVREEINRKINEINKNIELQPEITITYFIQDKFKKRWKIYNSY